MRPWWRTCRVDTLLFFFLSTKKKVSKNSVNFEMKYHQDMVTISIAGGSVRKGSHQKLFRDIGR